MFTYIYTEDRYCIYVQNQSFISAAELDADVITPQARLGSNEIAIPRMRRRCISAARRQRI